MAQESRLAVTIDSRGAQRDAKAITKELGSLEGAGNRVDPAMRKAGSSMEEMGRQAADAGSKVRGLGGQAGTLANLASGLAAPLAAAFSAAKIAAAAEQYTNITNRLRLVTEGSEQLAYAQQSVYDVAQKSRQSLETTAQVYQRIAQNGRQLGLSFADVASVTETVAKTVALSGASAQAADAAMVQFGQALASGTLRGDELNSILEQTPALAQAIARGLGVSIGQLRTMGSEGKLTSEAVVKALQQQKDKVDELSSSLTTTVSQAVTAFNNSLVATVGRLDEATGASSRLANGIASLARAMDGFNSGEFLDFFRADKQTVAGLNNELSVTLAGIRDLQGARSRLSKSDASDTVLFNFRLYNRKEIDDAISDLEGKAGTIRTIVSRMQKTAAGIGAQAPQGENPATSVNAEYEKLLSNLKRQAALQGQNTEAAKVRYAIETGELGKLLPDQEKLLLKYAEEKDAKVAAEKASKAAAAAAAKANASSTKGVAEAANTFARLYAQYDPAAQAARDLTKEQGQLNLAFTKGDITQEEYNKALAQASINYAAVANGVKGLAAAEQYREQINRKIALEREGYQVEAKSVGMGDVQAGRYRQTVALESQMNEELLTLQSNLTNAQTAEQKEGIRQQIQALRDSIPARRQALQDGFVAIDQEKANPFNGWTASLQNFQAQAANVAGQTQSLFTNAFGTITSGVGSAFEKMALEGQTFGESVSTITRSLVGGVINSLGQMAAQWAVNQALQVAFGGTQQALSAAEMARIAAETTARTASISTITTAKVAADGITTSSSLASTATTTTAQVAAAGTTLSAWLPAALVASVGTFGAAAIVGGTALLAAFALIKGFSTGGYVSGSGTGTSDSIPARLSNGEFVVNAKATARNRELLEAINSNERVSFAGENISLSRTQAAASGQQQQAKQEVYILNNSNAVVQTRSGEDGRLEVLIQAVEDRFTDQVATGWGAFPQVLEQFYAIRRNAT